MSRTTDTRGLTPRAAHVEQERERVTVATFECDACPFEISDTDAARVEAAAATHRLSCPARRAAPWWAR